jgi:hypothetical protein
MPSIQHEAVVELLHRNRHLVAALLAPCGIRVSADTTAVIADSNLSARTPIALTAEIVIELTAPDGTQRVVIFEVQKDPPKPWKRRAWAAYVTLAGVRHKCDAILVVIALRAETARACSSLIRTGHPGFNLAPIVIGPDNTPDPASQDHSPANAELTVLAVLTGALDLSDREARTFILETLARTDPDRQAAYTRLILTIASEADQRALEELMSTVYRDNLVDRLLAEGEARGEIRGEANMLLRILAARGFTLPGDIHDRITSCTDTARLEAWAARAVTAETIAEVFSD